MKELECGEQIIGSWTEIDDCGNSTAPLPYFSILDNQGHVSENPANAVVDCDQAPTTIPSIEIYDACGHEVQIIEASQTILAVFLNPANENATFTFSSTLRGRGKLEVFDMTGAKVAELFNNNIINDTEYRVDLNVSVLARGIYTYRITNGMDTEVGRLIVTK